MIEAFTLILIGGIIGIGLGTLLSYSDTLLKPLVLNKKRRTSVMAVKKIAETLKKDIPMILILFVLFAVSSIILVLLVRSEREKNKVLSKYRAERIIQALLESYRSGEFDSGTFGQEIRGFGLYKLEGAPIQVYGSAPEKLDPGIMAEKKLPFFWYNRKKGSMIFVRESRPGIKDILSEGRPEPERPPRDADRPPREGDRPPREFDRPKPPRDLFAENGFAYIFLEVDVAYFFQSENFITFIFIFFIVILFGLIIGFWGLYKRNREYRNKIESQKQLVVLGGAARTIAHEIKNPLSIIKLQTGLIKKIAGKDIDYEVGVIDEEVNRLRVLTDKVREFLREPVGRPETIDAVKCIKQLVTKIDSHIGIDILQDECFISFDPDLFRSVIENLLKNALESGSAVDEIWVRVKKQKKNVVITLWDRGEGLPEDREDKIFDPFFTSKNTGSGIGLFISKRFVEAAGGSLKLKNRKNSGVEARIIVPIMRKLK